MEILPDTPVAHILWRTQEQGGAPGGGYEIHAQPDIYGTDFTDELIEAEPGSRLVITLSQAVHTLDGVAIQAGAFDVQPVRVVRQPVVAAMFELSRYAPRLPQLRTYFGFQPWVFRGQQPFSVSGPRKPKGADALGRVESSLWKRQPPGTVLFPRGAFNLDK